MSTLTDAVGRALHAVEAECAPERMSQAEALEFYEELISQLEASVDALRDEMRDPE